VVLLLSRQNLRRFLVGCIIAAPLLRLFLVLFVTNSDAARYAVMPCRMDALALGGLVAILARARCARLSFRTHVRCGLIITTIAALGVYVFVWQRAPTSTVYHPLMSSLGYSLNAIAFTFLLAMIVSGHSPRLAALLSWRPLAYTGEIAYGLYLLHGPAAWVGRRLLMLAFGTQVAGHSAVSVPITFLASFLAAGVSYRFFESPILALKERFATSPSQHSLEPASR
jgi:peptidoglycan/LPS O-acetylase OafA/YrhL